VAKGGGGDPDGSPEAVGDGVGRDREASAGGEDGRETFRGYSWGSAVHGALAAAADDPSETRLVASCRDFLLEHGRPVDDHGDPVELQELVELVHAVRASELWRRAERSERRLAEVPFAVPGNTRPPPAPESGPPPTRGNGTGRRQLDLFGSDGTGARRDRGRAGEPPSVEAREDMTPAVLEGVIDLVFREEDGWVIADYKTDVGTDPDFEDRVVRYRRQVELYADAWSRLTGETVKERVLYFTAQDRVEAW
jgi:ATP-dependent exoDNAse (exonuclease V) beta subunit